jgi:hypothetical protein
MEARCQPTSTRQFSNFGLDAVFFGLFQYRYKYYDLTIHSGGMFGGQQCTVTAVYVQHRRGVWEGSRCMPGALELNWYNEIEKNG